MSFCKVCFTFAVAIVRTQLFLYNSKTITTMKDRHSFNPIDMLKRSIKSWLLPYPFKIVGFFLLLAVLVALAAEIFFNVNVVAGDVIMAYEVPSSLRRAMIVALYLAMFFISCSRERNEDEMTASLRGETLKEVCYVAFFVWVAYRVVMAFVAQDLLYITHDEPFVTPFIMWVLYYARFESKMKALRRQSRKFTL